MRRLCSGGRIILAALALMVTSVSAQSPGSAGIPAMPPFDQGAFTGATFIAENDVLFQLGHNADRNYTGGFGFQFGGSFVRRWHLADPLRGLNSLTLRKSPQVKSWNPYYSMLIVGTGFTPDSLNTPNVLVNDRPYGSILGFSVRETYVEPAARRKAVSTELVIGALGLHAARNLQTWLHRRLRAKSGEVTPYDPLGWPNQISDGGEITALYRVNTQWLVAGSGSGPNVRKHAQLVLGGEGSVGYYTNVTGLSSARAGWFTTDFWEFNPSATGSATQNLGQKSGQTIPRWEAFVFVGARPRLIAYNALLQGQFRQSAHTFSASEIERLQLEFEAGIAGFVPIRSGGIGLIWNAYSGRTKEFKASEEGTHSWGSLLLTVSFRPGR